MPSTVAAANGAVGASVRAVFADEAAFRDWYEYALPRVYRYLYHRCGRNQAVAEELTQETFVAAVRSGRRFSGSADALGWVIGIARHRLADHYRKLERQERGLATLALHLQEHEWATGEPDYELTARLDALPAMQRAAVVLHYLDDLPVREVARLVQRSEKAVESLLSRARRSLRRGHEGDRDG